LANFFSPVKNTKRMLFYSQKIEKADLDPISVYFW
jgi:hypothetical protein